MNITELKETLFVKEQAAWKKLQDFEQTTQFTLVMNTKEKLTHAWCELRHQLDGITLLESKQNETHS